MRVSAAASQAVSAFDTLHSVSHIFLSYARPDRKKAAALARELTRCGWSVWWDHNMLPGHEFDKVIGQQLREAACVVVLWSAKAVESAYVRDEARRALKRNVLIPALIEDVDPPLGFGEHHTANLVGWNGQDAIPDLDLLKQGIAHFVKPVSKESAETTALLHRGDWDPLRGSHGTKQNVTPRLFICYRRRDSIDTARRLHETLTQAYGPEAIFMDLVGEVDPHAPDQVDLALSGCRAVLVLMGRTWLDATDRHGKRKLDDPADHVRLEVATALKLGVSVIPILLQNASMPRATDLPEEIRALVFHNGIKLVPEFWRADVERLIEQLDRVMKP